MKVGIIRARWGDVDGANGKSQSHMKDPHLVVRF